MPTPKPRYSKAEFARRGDEIYDRDISPHAGPADEGKFVVINIEGAWETKRLEHVTDCFDHVRIPLNEIQRVNRPGPYPYCGANGVLDYVDDFVLDDDVILIAEDGGYFDEYAYRPIAYRMSGKIWVNNHAHILKAKFGYSQGFLFYSLVHKNILPYLASGTRAKLNKSEMNKIEIYIPLDSDEQETIAAVLSDVDGLIGALEKLIAKKQAIKQAVMQQLLTGKTRLPGFGGAWETKRLEHVTDCFDHVRIPLNEIQRVNRPGPYPYCGANGVLDYVDDFVLDDDVILIAEDGGYFDEYAYRPIAYRMSGKIWVNNHAHILKAKFGYSQGFLFYSLVHKNILPYLASGTRAKLNKSEMNKIEIYIPLDSDEQETIAAVLSDMDAEIAALERRRDKTRAIKQGMMQQLLTGRVRLVKPE